MSDNYVAAIAYDDEQTDYTFAVYKKHQRNLYEFCVPHWRTRYIS